MKSAIIILVGLLGTSGGIRAAGATPAGPPTEADVAARASELPPGIDDGWTEDILSQLAIAEYAATVTDRGLQAPNRAQNLRTIFRPDRVEIVPRTSGTPAWRLAWRTLGVGRAGVMSPVTPATPVASGCRVEYVRDDLVEWYENGPKGLEQGFTIATRPRGSGRVVIDASVRGVDELDLRGVQNAPSGAIEFVIDDGMPILRYDALTVLDAEERELPATLDLDGDRVHISVDDRDAVYPITVDPLVTAASWFFTGEGGGSLTGVSVNTAGDVNGDGFSDVIVGAPDFDDGLSDQGRVYVFHGSPNGLDAVPDWTASGGAPNAYLGASVSAAGDVNGDGYDDIVVGASLYSNGQTTEGAVCVWHGGPGGLGPDGTFANADFVVEGDQAFAQFGGCVAWAGDVDGDGYDDIIAGARLHTVGFTREGRASVYYGSASGVTAAGAWHVYGGQTDAALGIAVAGAGDVNGDGYADVIVGAPGYVIASGVLGSAFVWLGGASGLPASPSPATAAWSATDGLVGTDYAHAVAGAGDVNGDGYADVVVGAPHSNNLGTEQGVAFLYPGSAGGPTVLPTWQWSAAHDDAFTAIAVAPAGDVNGDGYADVVVGASGADSGSRSNVGAAYIFEGSGSGLNGTPTSELFGNVTLGAFGSSVSSAGDVDGDGYGDVIVGQPLVTNGRAFVYAGRPADLSVDVAFQATFLQAGGLFGLSVASAGDMNGDGYDDVIVGAPLYDNGQPDEGIAIVYPGSANGVDTSGQWLAESNQTGSWFGYDVASAGDVNGDGYADVIIGARDYVRTQPDEGGAFIWFGGPSGLGANGNPTNVDWRVYGGVASAKLGTSVATAGDVNGDGVGDVIVGAPGIDEVRVYHGVTGAGPSMVPAWVATSDVPGSGFGEAASTAGDVDRNGYSDVIIGAPQYTDDAVTEHDEGWVFVWLGRPGGLGPSTTSADADWSAESDQADAAFGIAAESAGDVNGDGYSDVIVGASLYDDTTNDEGAVFVWYGSDSGLGPHGVPSNAGWVRGSNEPGAAFGFAVSSAGDVNADGFGDIVVGAYGYTAPEPGEGWAFVFLGAATGPGVAADWMVQSDLQSGRLGWSVGGGCDVNGDGFGDVIVGAPGLNGGALTGGRVQVHQGNGGGGTDRPIQQRRFDNTAPIHSLGISDTETAIRLLARGRTPAGRGHVRLEWEVKPLAVRFSGTGLGRSPAFLDTGAPAVDGGSQLAFLGIVGSLYPGFDYHWRARILTDSPYYPRSPWFALSDQTQTRKAFGTAGTAVAVPDTHVSAAIVPARMLDAAPNPFSDTTRLRFSLVEAADAELVLYDVAGRRLATLVHGWFGPGTHAVGWDGRVAGTRIAPGVYVVAVQIDGARSGRKLVVSR